MMDPMAMPVRLRLDVEYLNVPEDFNREWLIDTVEVNVTLLHSWWQVQEAIWTMSPDTYLKPMFTKIHFNGQEVNSSQIIGSYFGFENSDNLKVVVDLTLINSPIIPNRYPPTSLFDIVILWRGHKIKLRESLKCTVSSLKEYLYSSVQNIERKDLVRISIENTKFKVELDHENDDMSLSQLLQLDVCPLNEVNILASMCPPVTPWKYCVSISSWIPELQQHEFHMNRYATGIALRDQIHTLLGMTRMADFHFKWKGIEFLLSDMPLYDEIDNLTKFTEDKEVLFETIKLELQIDKEIYEEFRLDPGAKYFVDVDKTPEVEYYQPLQVKLENGQFFDIHGETYESLVEEDGGNVTMINQADLSSTDYVFGIRNKDREVSVTLGSSQCIVVDNGQHEPYVLLNPAGAAKLKAGVQKANLSGLQKLQVHFRDEVESSASDQFRSRQDGHGVVSTEPAIVVERAGVSESEQVPVPAATPTVQEDPIAARGPAIRNGVILQDNNVQPRVFRRIFQLANENMQNILSAVIRYSIILYMLGLHTLLLNSSSLLLVLGLIWGSIYVMFFTGDRVTNWLEANFLRERPEHAVGFDASIVSVLVRGLRYTNSLVSFIKLFVSVVRSELVTIAVTRPHEYEFIVRHDDGTDNLWFYICDTWNSFWKDVLLMGLSFFPSSQALIQARTEQWKANESADLKTTLDIYTEQVLAVIEQYQTKYGTHEKTPDELLKGILGRVNLGELGTDIESLGLEESKEEYYQISLAQYRELRAVQKVFSRAIHNGQPIAE
ncbi:hypothetical protein CAAN3_07S06700 [[Candida] anglica]